MAPGVPVAIFAFLAIGLALSVIGARLLKRGLWPRRQGSEPHCRPCGYLLLGIQSERCPECGTLLSPVNIVHGQRRRRPGLAWGGVALLLFGIAVLVQVTILGVGGIDWYHYKPTFLVMRDLRSGRPAAMQELNRRESAGDLSSSYEQQLIEMALVQQAAGASNGLAQPLIEFLEQQYVARHVTDAQNKRFGQQSVLLYLRIRPVVVMGDRVPYQLDESSRICGPGFYVHVEFTDGQIDVDGKTLRQTGNGGTSMNGLGAGGSSGGSVQCDSVGKHQLSVNCRVELRQGSFGAGTAVFQENRTLTGNFEVVSEPPPGAFQLINNPALGNLIQASIVPARFDLSAGDPRTLHGELAIKTIPANIAFDVFARFDGREYKFGTLTCNKGSGADYRVSGNIRGLSATTQPSAFDLILRSNEKLGRETINQHDIWNGELVYPTIRATQAVPGTTSATPRPAR